MKISILLFGVSKDIVGDRVLSLDMRQNATVSDLKSEILSKYPAFEDLASLAIAVNNDYARDQLVIQSNDEIALIPPVSGG